MGLKFKSLVWQCVPSFFASLLAFLFGLMVGWPCVAYPYLLQETSIIPISLDQSAMIAGFLMIGVSVASPFACRYGIGTKFGLIICLMLNLVGWLIILFGTTIYNLLAGRLLIGAAFGYGQGQVKKYIGEFCEPTTKQTNLKLFGLHTGIGITTTFLIGCFVAYNNLVLICTIISSIVLVFSMFLPHPPIEYLQFKRDKYAVKILVNIKMRGNVFYDLQELKLRKDIKNPEDTISNILKTPLLRKNFIILACLTFFQQFSGLPSTLIYCTIIFDKFGLNSPEIFAAVYSLLYVLVQAIVSFYFMQVNKKVLLLLSSLFVTLTLILVIFVIHYELCKKYTFVAVILMYLYQFFHALGLGTVTATLIQDYFPPKARSVVANYYLIFFSMFALVATKVFQVLFTLYAFEVPFALFFAVAVSGFIFITIFVPYNRTVNE